MRWALLGLAGLRRCAILLQLAAVWLLLQGASAQALTPLADAPRIRSLAIPVAIFGKDDRIEVPDRMRTLEDSIGLLYNETSLTICTAFCVAPDLIATASHCLFRDKPAASPLAQFVFSIDRPDGKISSSIAGAADGTERQNVMTGAMRLKLRPPIDAASDWAVVRLAQPMCAGHALPVRVLTPAAIESAARAQKVFQVSFHADFGDWELAYSQACDVRQEFEGLSRTLIHKEFTHPEGLLLHRCDTGEASSGSPILMETDSGPVVIGINVGTYVQSRILLRNGKVEKTFKPRTIANTGVNADHFSREIETFRQSKVLSSSAEIARIQHALRALRLYSGPTNGRYGELTRAAIVAFERSKRLPETGLPTSELAARLLRRPPLPERKPGSRSAALHGTGG